MIPSGLVLHLVGPLPYKIVTSPLQDVGGVPYHKRTFLSTPGPLFYRNTTSGGQTTWQRDCQREPEVDGS